MIKNILLVILWIPIFIGMTGISYAAEDFASSYDVAYDVGEDGITTVTEKVTLRNLTSQFYATQSNLTIGSTQITEVKASDGSGPVETKVEQKDTVTNINVKFNQQVTGLGKELPWTLQFKSKDFAQKQGKIWEISIPKTSSEVKLDNYKVTLSVPLIFGEPTLITPIPKSQTTNFGKMFLTFDKTQLQSNGISVTFGNNQLYDFNLSYHLENTGIVPILTNIALPPDTDFQDVIYQRIEPKPINVTVDTDGNYLAWYRLNRSQKLDVTVIGSAKLYTKSKVINPVLDPGLREKYTKGDKYWEVDNPAIKNKLSEILKDNPKDDLEKVRLIYKYVVGFLKYDSTRQGDDIERFGAVTALNNPTNAVCMEFTDLFITLTRGAGIPARELDGFAYTTNSTLRPLSLDKDILHSWAQYWDGKQGWVMVDPTWENTTQGVDYFNKLDLNHFVFVVKGISSEAPVPAGSYRYKGQDSKDVKVTLSEIDFLGKPQLDVVINTPNEIWSGLPGKFKVKLSNQGNSVLYPYNFSIGAGKFNLLNTSQKIGPIPAFGHQELIYDYRTKSFFDNFTDTVEVAINGQKYEKPVSIKPFLIFQMFPFVFVLIIFGMVSIYFIVLGALIYRKRRKPQKKEPEVKKSRVKKSK